MKKLVLITSIATMFCFAIVACKKTDTTTPSPASTTVTEYVTSIPVSFNRGILGINPDAGCISGPGVCTMKIRSSVLSIAAVLVNGNDSPLIRIPISYYNTYVKDFAGDSIHISSEVLLDSATASQLVPGNNPQWKFRPRPQGYPIIRTKCVSGYNGYNITCPAGDYGITFHKDDKGNTTDVDIHL